MIFFDVYLVEKLAKISGCVKRLKLNVKVNA